MAHLVQALVRGGVGGSTYKTYKARFEAWAHMRISQGKSPWMTENDNPDDVINALTEFMAMRCFVHKNQQTTVRGYLAAIKYFHKVHVGWDLPTTHGMIQAVGKGIDRAHASINAKPHTRRPLTWPLLKHGRQLIIEAPEYGPVMW